MSASVTLRCPVLVGRDDELDALVQAIEGAVAGQPVALTVLRRAGVGKTRLVAEASRAARSFGCTVLTGRCSRTTREVAFRPLAEALLAATRELEQPTDDALAPFLGVRRVAAQSRDDPATGGATKRVT